MELIAVFAISIVLALAMVGCIFFGIWLAVRVEKSTEISTIKAIVENNTQVLNELSQHFAGISRLLAVDKDAETKTD